MITIRKHYEKTNVLFSDPGSGRRGYSRDAADLEEAFTLIRHYHGKEHDRANCQFCQESNERERKSARKHYKKILGKME